MDEHTRVELSRAALEDNVRLFRRLCPRSAFMAVVKSNAYGHGLEECVRSLSGAVDWFGVNSIAEARAVRGADAKTPILVMGRFEDAGLRSLAADGVRGVTVVLSSADDLAAHAEAANIPFHLKVDTGMGRLGTHGSELQVLLEQLAARPELPWTGLMTHFANVEDVTDQTYARRQLARFFTMRDQAAQAAGRRALQVHAAASAPALLLPESRLDLVRVGISLYGLWPSRETKISARSLYPEPLELRPVMRWLTRVVHVNQVRRDECIGYGCTYQADRDMRIAVLPVGYFEGYDRKLSNAAHVSIAGRRARVVGRVCMNMIMVDVTDLPEAALGSEAVLFGDERAGDISADQLADLAGTINYEITTRVNHDLARRVVA